MLTLSNADRTQHSPRISGLAFVVALASLVIAGLMPQIADAQKRPGNRTKRSGGKPPAVKIRLPESVRRKPDSTMQVAAVSASGRSDAITAAARLDSLVRDGIYANDQTPNGPADDATFLRRVYLDVAGRIPTLQEAESFLADTSADKRMDLVDRLLSSPDYVSHYYNFWADTLRLVERPQANLINEPFMAYVKDAVRTNRPYDEWVYEMLTADGKPWDNPAVGFQLRDTGMPLPYVDNTVRIFLGTQIGCAQCHDHPFDSWTQYQFYQLAAYTAGTRTRIMKGDPGYEKRNPSSVLIDEARKHYDKGRVPGAFQRLVRANTYMIREVKSRLKLPHDYAYGDAKPNEVVQPEVLWGDVPSRAAKSTPREQFAAWVTDVENERFRQTVGNRLWAKIMGVGVVDPIDDFRDDNPPTNEALLDGLSEVVAEADFDLKQVLRSILYSDTYGAQSVNYDITSGEPFHFNGPAVRRMSAEQVWDSLLTMAVQNPNPFARPDAATLKPVLDLDFSKATFASVKAQSERFSESYFMSKYKRNLREHSYQGNVLCRASELPTPSPADHFLRQFGQGDREVINGADDSATVPQILAMFNGPITHVMLEPGSKIVDDVLAIKDTRERVDAIFLSVLSRPPESRDRLIAAGELARQKNDNVGFGNIIWALLNTREFLFIR